MSEKILGADAAAVDSARSAEAVPQLSHAKPRKRTFYMLRLRHAEGESWWEPEEFTSRKERDRCASFNRSIGGLRTWSYEERRAVADSGAGCDSTKAATAASASAEEGTR